MPDTGSIRIGGVGDNSPRYAPLRATIHTPPAHTPQTGGIAALRGPVVPLRGSARAFLWPHARHAPHSNTPPARPTTPLTGWDPIP